VIKLEFDKGVIMQQRKKSILTAGAIVLLLGLYLCGMLFFLSQGKESPAKKLDSVVKDPNGKPVQKFPPGKTEGAIVKSVTAKATDKAIAGESDASFDFSEVRLVPAKPAAAPVSKAAKYVIPEENLKIPDKMQGCVENLRKIYAAIRKYEKDKGKEPDWLSALIPGYLDEKTLLCPNDASHNSRFYPDPKLACSYCWEFSSSPVPPSWDPTGRMLCRDWKKRQVKFFGDIVPMLRCLHHGSKKVLNLSASGQVWWGQMNWEYMFKPDYRIGDESSW